MFDGHGGPEVAACIRQNVIKLFFEDVNFLGTSEVNKVFLEEVKDSLIKAFLLADSTLANDCSVNSSLGTMTLIALIFERYIHIHTSHSWFSFICTLLAAY